MRVVVLALALSCAVAACLPAADQPPQNGRLPDNTLTTVTPSCRVPNDVEPALSRLLLASKADGTPVAPETESHLGPLPVTPPSIESCYRSYAMQQWWRDFYCFFGNCALAAVPGTSIHGWGRAVDFEDAAGELTFSSAGYQWLQAHAAAYGFVHPAWAEPGQPGAEAWHWEFTG
jgi:D-alanyl-D-alanine carboxypeptidase